MRKILPRPRRLALSILGLAITAVVVFSCKTTLNAVDYSCQFAARSTALGNVYVNAEVPIEIQMYGDVMKTVEVDVEYLGSGIQGALYDLNQKEIKANDVFKYKFEQPLRLMFRPTSATKLDSLKFKINNESVIVALQVNNPTHGLVFSKEQDTVILGKNIPLQFAAVEDEAAMANAKTKAGGNSYKLSATMTEGKGILIAKEKALFSYSLVTKASTEEIELAKEEVVNAIFIPLEAGSNTIQFTLTDSYGNTVNQTKTMEAEFAPLSLAFNATRATAELGQTLLYDMVLAMDGYTGGFQFAPTLLSGAGVLKIDGQSVPLTSPFKVASTGTKKLIFEATKSGPIEIGFEVFDDFGGSVRDTLRGVIEDNSFKVTTTFEANKTIKYMETIPLVVKIAQEAASADYTYIVECNSKDIVLKKENQVIEFGKSQPITSGLYNYSITGSACGDIILTFKVRHTSQDKEVVLNVPMIKVSPFPLVVNLLNQSSTTTRLNTPITFDLQFVTDNAPADLKYEITPTIKAGEGTIYYPSDKDDLKLANGVYTGKKGTYQFTYTPTQLGANTVEFDIYDTPQFGQHKTVSMTVNVQHAAISAIPSITEIKGAVNTAVGFNVAVSEPDYHGDFKLLYTGGTGVLKNNLGEIIQVGKSTTIKKGTTLLSYTPTTPNTETLIFGVTDEYSQTAAFQIKVISSHVPMTFAAAFAQSSSYINAPISLGVNITGATPIKVKYIGGLGGLLKRSGVTVAQNTEVELTANEIWEYTPTALGKHAMQFTATDKNGQVSTANTLVDITHIPLTFETAFTAASTTIHTASDLKISLSGGTPIKVKYDGGTGVVKRSNIIIQPNTEVGLIDNETWTYTPTTVGDHSLSFTATDKNGQVKTSSASIKSTHAPMTFTTSFTSSSVIITTPITLNMGVGGAVPFKVRYSGGVGVVKRGGVVVQPGTDVTVNGTETWDFIPSNVGDHTLSFTATDKNDQTKTTSASVSSTHAPMTFTTSCAPNSVIVTTPTTINMGVGGAVPFRVKYSGGTGTMRRGGAPIGQGSEVSVSGNEAWEFTPTTIGEHALTFTAIDKDGQQKVTNISTSSTHAPMSFSSNFTAASGFVSRPVNVSVNASGAAPIKVQYSGGSGTMYRSGSVIGSGSDVTVSGNETWSFTPTTLGLHSLSFTATDKDGQQKSSTTNYTTTVASVSTSMSPANSSVVVNNTVSANLNVSNEAGDRSYTLTVGGSHNGTLNITSGTKYTASNGVIGLTFTPNAIRSHAITITATDDYGQSATTTWTIDAVPAEIEASFTGGGGQIYLGFTTNLSLYINKPHYAGQYNVSYSISGASGSLSQQPAQVNNGSTTRMTYTPKAKGTHIITVDIRDSEGKTKKLTQAVFVVLPTMTTTSTPGMFGIRLIHSERERKFYNPYEQINLDQYPSGATFQFYGSNGAIWNASSSLVTVSCPNNLGEKRISLLEVIDMWGQSIIFQYEATAVSSKYD